MPTRDDLQELPQVHLGGGVETTGIAIRALPSPAPGSGPAGSCPCHPIPAWMQARKARITRQPRDLCGCPQEPIPPTFRSSGKELLLLPEAPGLPEEGEESQEEKYAQLQRATVRDLLRKG